MTRTPVLLADEISTGLDSATAFDICSALKAIARAMNRTIAVALLQPTPETYGTFDEVLVMAAGQIAYLGPREQVPCVLRDVCVCGCVGCARGSTPLTPMHPSS